MIELIARLERSGRFDALYPPAACEMMLEAAAALREKEQQIASLREECEFAGRRNRALSRELADLRRQAVGDPL